MEIPTEWKIEPIQFEDENRILVKFPYNKIWIEQMRLFKKARWSPHLKGWHVPDCKENRITLGLTTMEIETGLRAETLGEIESFRHWLLSKRYSSNTIQTYLDALKCFLKYFNLRKIETLNSQDLIDFNNNYILKNKLSASYQNQVVNAVKLFFRIIQNKAMNEELVHRPKRPKLLPNVLSKEEVKLILLAHSNLKHRTMLSLIYSSGLRCGELLALKPEQVDRKRQILIIKQSKGRKDRITPLSTKILELLDEYLILYKPQVYVFEGMKKGEPYDERSLQMVLKQALKKSGIAKPVSLHWLRHSYATHLLENGTDLRYIQEILGHSSSRTTEIYTHVSTNSIQKIISPFDYL